MKTRLPLILSLVLAVGLLWTLRPTSPPQGTPNEIADSSAPLARQTVFSAIPQKHFPTLLRQPGDQLSWRYLQEVAIGPAGIVLNSAQTVRGILHHRVIERSQQGWIVLAALSEVFCDRAGVDMTDALKLLAQTPVRMLIAPDGRILEISFPAHLGKTDREWLTLLHRIEVVTRPLHQFLVIEPDGFQAWYRFDQDRPGLLVKQRTAPASAGVGDQHVRQSKFEARIRDGRLDVFQGIEETEIVLDEGNLGFATSYRIDMVHEPASSIPLCLQDPIEDHFTADPLPGATSRLDQLAAEELTARWSSVPAADVLDRFAEASSASRANALTDLQAWLSVHGASGRDAVLERLRQLADAGEDGSVSSALVFALASGSPEVQAGLVRVLQNPSEFGPVTLLQGLVAAGNANDPAVFEALTHWANSDTDRYEGISPRETALLSLGRLAETQPELRQILAQDLPAWFAPDVAMDESALAFSVLANAGLEIPEATQMAEDLLRNPDLDAGARRAMLEYLSTLPDSHLHPEIIAARLDEDSSIRAISERVMGREP
jgi:hypothetical protein